MKSKKGTITIRIILVCALCVMLFSAYKLWQTQQMYQEGDESYAQLITLVRKAPQPGLTAGPVTPQVNAPASSAPQNPQVEVPEIHIDFDALKKINPDAAAWLFLPDSPIDYPIMRADDYSWYLNHLADGTRNANGALFLDYNCPQDFSGALSVIYGHNMKSDKMFGSLDEYKKQPYYEEHPYMYLYTADDGNYRINLLYGCVVGANQWRERAFMFEANLPALLAYAQHNTTFVAEEAYTEADRFVVLSTCSYEFDDARYILIGKLVPEYAQTVMEE